MIKSNHCANCNLEVAEDLAYCPLCGKHMFKGNTPESKETPNSYPRYDFLYIYRRKWLKQLGLCLLFAGILCIGINLMYKTEPFWFPYALIFLYALWKIVFMPFKEGQNHIKRLPASGLIIAISLILIDLYNHCALGLPLGWAIVFAGPSVLTLTIVLSFIIALATPKYDTQVIKGMIYVSIVNVVFFALRFFVLKGMYIWPNFMALMASVISLFILFVFKRKRLVKEVNRNFHI